MAILIKEFQARGYKIRNEKDERISQNEFPYYESTKERPPQYQVKAG